MQVRKYPEGGHWLRQGFDALTYILNLGRALAQLSGGTLLFSQQGYDCQMLKEQVSSMRDSGSQLVWCLQCVETQCDCHVQNFYS